MPLDFILLSALALVFYGFTFFLLRRRIPTLRTLITELEKQPKESTRSYLMGWILRGRGAGESQLMHLFEVFSHNLHATRRKKGHVSVRVANDFVFPEHPINQQGAVGNR
jgi:hypothetical protein